MVWKAFLISIEELSIPNDTIDVRVKFQESISGKEITKSYNLHASNFQDIDTFRNFIVLEEIEKLNKFEVVKSNLKTFIDKEIK